MGVDGGGDPSFRDGNFFNANRAAVDSARDVYVMDLQNYRVQKFDRDGNFIGKWGSEGTVPAEFGTFPYRIAIDPSQSTRSSTRLRDSSPPARSGRSRHDRCSKPWSLPSTSSRATGRASPFLTLLKFNLPVLLGERFDDRAR